MPELMLLVDFIVFAAILWAARVIANLPISDPWVKGLTAAQTAVTVLAVILAATWYIFEQPHSGKIKLDQNATAVPGPSGRAVILSEIAIINVGTSVINLKDAKMKIFAQRVYPYPLRLYDELDKFDKKKELIINPAENWESIADLEDNPRSFLQSGETDNYYYRVAINCQSATLIYLTVRLQREPMFWDFLFGVRHFQYRKQSLVDLGPACSKQDASNKETKN